MNIKGQLAKYCIVLFLATISSLAQQNDPRQSPTSPISPSANSASSAGKAAASDISSFTKEAYVYEQVRTHVRYEQDGKGVRDLAVRIRIQSDSAVHRFGLLRFQYSSAFESLAIEYVRVHKPDGTLVNTPSSDVQDLDSEVSREAPMYTDEREKHVAVKTLAAGDVLDYHVVWTVHDAVAPGHFWLDDNPVKDAICLDEQMEFDFPKDLPVKFSSSWVTPEIKESGNRKTYFLRGANLQRAVESDDGLWEKGVGRSSLPAIRLSTFQSWAEVGKWFVNLEASQAKVTSPIQAKADELTKDKNSQAEKIQALYSFVSQNFRYIGVSLGLGRYAPHRAEEILANRYGDCKDKHTLFQALLAAAGIKAYPALISSGFVVDSGIPAPDLFDHLITAIPSGESFQFLDTTPEVGPFGYLLPPLREKSALVMADDQPARLVKTPATTASVNFEKFHMDAVLDAQGILDGKGKIESTGDSELSLRGAFRATSESRWTELVQGLMGRMGFAGTVSDVAVAQPQAVGESFWFSYSYHRPDYSDWKDRQISVPLPPIILPAIAEKRKKLADSFVLGSPVEVTYEAEVTLPKGTRPVLPPNVDLDREFAIYTARYSFEDGVLKGVRHLKTRLSEVAGSQRTAYVEFVESVLADQARTMLVMGSSGAAASPSRSAHSNNEEAQLLYGQAYESLQLGAPRAAITTLERVTKMDPDWADGWLLLGQAQLMIGQHDQGIATYRKAAAVDPSNPEAWRILARALGVLHHNREAIEA
jgi:transglutaminase-like putative cysteine protease